MSTLAQQLTDLVQRAANSAGHADAPIPIEPCVATNDPRHGDYQSNYAFRLGKALRTNPRAVAQAMVDALPANDLVAGVEVAGPGFINFRLADEALAADVLERIASPTLGAPQTGSGRSMVIDYSSPNIAKRMHVGHLRSTIIGAAIDRMHRFLGWSVVADNHIGDWGTQFGMLIVAWHRWRDEDAFAEDAIAELQRIYRLFREKAKEDESLEDLARAETAKLQAGDAENLALWERFIAVSMTEFEAVYTRLGVSFDVVHGESHYRDGLQELITKLLDDGIASINDGAAIIEFTSDEGKGLGNSPLLVRKSDGAALYGTTDLATIKARMETWNPETIVYVTDQRQQLHFQQVFAAGRRMGFTTPEYVHVWFGMVRNADGSIMASRKDGSSVTLVGLLDEARDKARSVVDKKSPELPEAERAIIAEAVGVGSIAYNDLSQNPQSDVTFDWERMLSLEGNTAPYLLYAHARCHSLFRKAGVTDFEPGGLVLGHPTERTLALIVARTPEVIAQSAATWRANMLCDHLYSLASAFASFYTECPVLKDDVDEATRQSRLTLTHATAVALATGLRLIGLEPLERM
ncbi:MAG: arginine--tRNA ligase [Proteobacteria bacterium]|nr:arginine--tRNA ligase [Pseudomonadota bacterium]